MGHGNHLSREPGVLESDKVLYGAAFLGPLGERLDPTHPGGGMRITTTRGVPNVVAVPLTD